MALNLDLDLQLATAARDLPTAAHFERWILATLEGRRERAALTVRLVDPEEGRALNLQYRGLDRPTNVLSFPSSATERALTGALGDLVICATVVAAEARAQRKAPAAHWAHMVVHGVLHLHGYDHESGREARAMEGVEVEILRGFGYQNPYRPVILRDT